MTAAAAPATGKDRLILALDFPSATEALAWSRRLKAEVGLVKVGLELFVAAGPSLVRQLAGEGHGVFLDLKLHDIPNTVAGAVLAAAAQAARAADPAPLLLGVTVLTSLDEPALASLGIAGPVPRRVLAWAEQCRDAGLAGVVCGVAEAQAVRAACGPDFLIVTPGIRPAGAPRHDQARVATAREARAAGADYLVVGRAVTSGDDPVAAARALAAEAQ